MNPPYDIICIGAGPTGLACAIEAKRAGLRPLVIDKGVLCNSLYRYPVNMVFFTTPELLEIGDLPFVSAAEKPTRVEALKYYRKCVEHYDLELRLGETVTRVDGGDGSFRVHTRVTENNPAIKTRDGGAGAASDDPVVERQKGVSSRESHGDQELSRATKSTPLLAHEKVLPAVHVFALTGYHPDFDFLRQLGVKLDLKTNKPALDAQTLESNVGGLYLAGVVIGGNHTSEIFIENGRFHGKQIIAALTGTTLAVAQP